MIVLVAAAGKDEHNLRIDALAPLVRQVRAGFKGEPVDARQTVLHQVAASPVGVRLALSHLCPGASLAPIEGVPFKTDRNACGGFAHHCVQHVCRNLTHSTNHFPKRICVICRCCSDASRSSASRLLASRLFKIASISSALLPVAHTI